MPNSFGLGKKPMSDGGKDACQVGRDELNLAELPIALVSERVPNGVKTVVFEGQHGRLTITGSDDYGLPTSSDSDIIVALIQLTKLANDFTDPTVRFTRYEVLSILGWPDDGRHYRRLDDSLKRWVGVTLRYDESWWDNDVKCRVDANFHILESVVVFDQKVRRKLRARHQPLPLSTFKWNDIVFRSFQAGNLKRLDLGTYFALRSAVSKQLFRFLDKRFYRRDDWTFDLRVLAFEHVGLSRNYTPAKIREKLKPALEELEGIGFLEPMSNTERYQNTGRGQWRIRFVRRAKRAKAETEPTGLEGELVQRGVTAATARDLVRDFAEDRIQAQIERSDWLRAKRPSKVKDFGAYLTDAIRKDYAAPAGFVGSAERAEREGAEREQRQREATVKARERDEEDRVTAYWQGLTPEQQAQLEAEAVARADPSTKVSIEKGPMVMRRSFVRLVREAYIRGLIGLDAAG